MAIICKNDFKQVGVGDVLFITLAVLMKSRQRLYDRRERRGSATEIRRRRTFFWTTIGLFGLCVRVRRQLTRSGLRVVTWLRSYKSDYDAIDAFVVLNAPNVVKVLRIRKTKFSALRRSNGRFILRRQFFYLRRLRKKFST